MAFGFGIKYVLASVVKGFACSIMLIAGMVLGGIVAGILGLQQPPMPAGFDVGLAVLLMIPAGMAISIALGELFRRLNQGFLERFVCLFLFNYTIYYFLQILEQVIFTTMMELRFGLISDIFPSLFLSLATARLWKPEREDRKIRLEVPKFFARRSTLNWSWRLIVAWLAYVPIYYLVGLAISPFVLPYYADSNMRQSLGIILPDTATMIGMQFVRGAFYLLASLIVIFLWNGSKRSLQLWLGFAIFIQVAAIPMIVGYWLPLGLKIPHAVELSTDSFLQAFVYVELLFVTIGGGAGRKAGTGAGPERGCGRRMQ